MLWPRLGNIAKRSSNTLTKPSRNPIRVRSRNRSRQLRRVRRSRSLGGRTLAGKSRNVVDIAARYEEQIRAAAESCPTPETLYDQAFAELALGDYTASCFSARRAANLALELRQKQPIDEPFHREAALNALLLLPRSPKQHMTHLLRALEEAGTLVDKEAAPLLWVEIHEPLADFLLEHAKLDRADDLISDIIDIREERQGEYHPDLAGTLILWTKLLYARANYCDMESVAIRAERIYTYQNPPHFLGFVSALNSHALALHKEGRYSGG